jgi:sugar O-acyltransferase (sialic acid O-acetyltransferase NeuD family)
MLIIGAKGFAKEVLETFNQQKKTEKIAFYDDVNEDIGDYLYNEFTILKNLEEVKKHFHEFGTNFTIGVGIPSIRKQLYNKFLKLGGKYSSTISPCAKVGSYDVLIGDGTNILSNAIISNSVIIGKGCIIYYGVIITHDCKVGDFVELSPNATLLGKVEIGEFSQIGASTTILPSVKIGKNVIIGASSLVTRDIPDNVVAYGNPAKVVRKLSPIKN